MGEERVLRIFRCRPRAPAYDALLRDTILPFLRHRPEPLGLWVGRRGPDDLGERVIATLWPSAAAMAAVVGTDVPSTPFAARLEAASTDPRIEVLPVLVDVAGDPMARGTVLRLARGMLRHDGLAAYAALVAAGARDDVAAGAGPVRLILGRVSEDAFLALSTWAGWEPIAAASGASPDRPVTTHRELDLLEFGADHFELLPDA